MYKTILETNNPLDRLEVVTEDLPTFGAIEDILLEKIREVNYPWGLKHLYDLVTVAEFKMHEFKYGGGCMLVEVAEVYIGKITYVHHPTFHDPRIQEGAIVKLTDV